MASKSEYVPIKNGEGFEVRFKKGKSEVFKIACADCGAVHRAAIADEKNGNLGIAVERDRPIRASGRRKGISGIKVQRAFGTVVA